MTRIPALHVGQATPVGPVTLFPVWADVRPPVAVQRAMRTDGAGQQHSVWDGAHVSAVTA